MKMQRDKLNIISLGYQWAPNRISWPALQSSCQRIHPGLASDLRLWACRFPLYPSRFGDQHVCKPSPWIIRTCYRHLPSTDFSSSSWYRCCTFLLHRGNLVHLHWTWPWLLNLMFPFFIYFKTKIKLIII